MTNEPTNNKNQGNPPKEEVVSYTNSDNTGSFFSGFEPDEKVPETTEDLPKNDTAAEEADMPKGYQDNTQIVMATGKSEKKPSEKQEKIHDSVPASFENSDDVAVPLMGRKDKDRSTKTQVMETTKDESDDFIFARYHRSSSRSHGKPMSSHSHHEEKKQETPVFSHSEQHFRYQESHKLNWKEMTAKKKVLSIISIVLCVIIGLLATGGITLGILTLRGNDQLTNYDNMDMVAPPISDVDVSYGGKAVNYKGKAYYFNENVTSILCMGIDKTSLGTEDGVVGTGGQADALYLVALNTKTGKTDVIAIPRDTWTDIGIYNPDGEYVGTQKHQICLAYSYGDGKETSCKNTVTATERLFFGLPIASYFSMDESAVPMLTDAVGGVTLTLTNSSYIDAQEVRHYEGETITIYGNEADRFLRLRDITQLESTVNRLDRQISFLKGFTSKAIAMTKKDLTVPLDLYSIVKDNSTTNLNPSKITAFATAIVTNGITELEFTTIPGELTSDGTYAQYMVDSEALYEIILDVYYTPAN